MVHLCHDVMASRIIPNMFRICSITSHALNLMISICVSHLKIIIARSSSIISVQLCPFYLIMHSICTGVARRQHCFAYYDQRIWREGILCRRRYQRYTHTGHHIVCLSACKCSLAWLRFCKIVLDEIVVSCWAIGYLRTVPVWCQRYSCSYIMSEVCVFVHNLWCHWFLCLYIICDIRGMRIYILPV